MCYNTGILKTPTVFGDETMNRSNRNEKMKKTLLCPYLKKLYPAKKERAAATVSLLETLYPEALCALEYDRDPFRLLVMAILSAQCTDKRVNLVAPALFDRFPDASAMAQAEKEDIEPYIKSCGLYKTKAKNLHATAQILVSRFEGKVPADFDALLSLPGIGRKVANLLMGDLFGTPGIVADTHCIRIANRWGLCDSKDPYRVEMQLDKLIPKEKQSDFCHRIVWFGRDCCSAPNPNCAACPLKAEFDRKFNQKSALCGDEHIPATIKKDENA